MLPSGSLATPANVMLAGALKTEFGAGLVIKTDVGGLFEPTTVTIKAVAVFKDPSLTVSAIATEPSRLEAGITVTKRFCPVPLNVMFAVGITMAFEEIAVTVSRAAGVSSSPIVKGTVIELFRSMV